MPSKPKVTKPDSYQGFIDSRIELNPLSESVVKYESFKLPKAFYVEFSLIDWASKKPTRDGNVIYSKWFVGLVLELTEFGTPELLELQIKGSAKDDGGENFRTGFYKGFTKNARPVAKWQTDFVNQNLNQFILRAMVEAICSLKKGKIGWEYHRRGNLISESESKNVQKTIDKRLRETRKPEFIAEVAAVYSQAKISGIHPTRFVMDYYETSRITASRWVRRAVDLKLLPEPEGQGKSSKPNKKLVQVTTRKEGKK